MIKPKSGTKSAKNTSKSSGTTQLTTDFGIRKISNQNFSKVIALPKIALENLGNYSNLKVELVQEKSEKFLKLSPVRSRRN